MYWVRKYSWERFSHWLLSSQLSSISSLGAKTARVTIPEHTAFWENSGRGSLGLNTNTKNRREKKKQLRSLYWELNNAQACLHFFITITIVLGGVTHRIQWRCSCKMVSGELILHSGNQVVESKWLNPRCYLVLVVVLWPVLACRLLVPTLLLLFHVATGILETVTQR